MNLYKMTITPIKRWMRAHMMSLCFAAILCIGGFIVLYPRIVIIIPAGHLGVLYRPFHSGVDETLVLGEGLRFILPWNSVVQYDGRIQLKKLNIDVLTTDQLKSKVSVTFQFEVNRLTVPLLHKYVGPKYVETVVIPEVTSITREMFGRLTSNQAFTVGINQVVRDIAINADQVIVNKLSPPGLADVRLVRISAVQLESIEYPKEIQAAIQDKLVLEQRAASYPFKIESESLEVQRKVLEAEGIRKFQEIVNPGLTDNYLRLQGIEATRKLAESSNSKIVIFGSAPTGLPLILGGDTGAAVAPVGK